MTPIRRIAIIIHSETGRSLQEVISEIVTALQGGRIQYPVSHCPICATKNHRIASTKSGENCAIRYHVCDFCTGTFVSEEIKPMKIPSNEALAVAPPKKKRHIKGRGA